MSSSGSNYNVRKLSTGQINSEYRKSNYRQNSTDYDQAPSNEDYAAKYSQDERRASEQGECLPTTHSKLNLTLLCFISAVDERKNESNFYTTPANF